MTGGWHIYFPVPVATQKHINYYYSTLKTKKRKKETPKK